jgi:hypothetical protein
MTSLVFDFSNMKKMVNILSELYAIQYDVPTEVVALDMIRSLRMLSRSPQTNRAPHQDK